MLLLLPTESRCICRAVVASVQQRPADAQACVWVDECVGMLQPEEHAVIRDMWHLLHSGIIICYAASLQLLDILAAAHFFGLLQPCLHACSTPSSYATC